MAKNNHEAEVLEQLYGVLLSRKGADPDHSYVARLYAKGEDRILQKVGEEAVETILAAKSGDEAALVSESADLLFHLLVMLADREIAPSRIMDELQRRMGTSGLAEAAARVSVSQGQLPSP